MNKLKLVITDTAKDDITAIVDYIANDNINAAKNTAMYLYKICNDLTIFPNIGITRIDLTNENLKFFVIKKRYIIVYKIEGKILYISRVLSGYQDICFLF
ncbi:MAG: type II toxin-antitoxin system RelE/ParE family toxin [Candidatus Gastranaerophilales bacterium]|nr:type II toxin-antitoxin system RelE/ParE family toxin [Candidatus Gastranaerophilales bacterium]